MGARMNGYKGSMSDSILDLGNGNGKAIMKLRSPQAQTIRGDVERANDEPREVEGYPMTAKLRPDAVRPQKATQR